MARVLVVQFPMETLQAGWFLVPIRPEGLARSYEVQAVPYSPLIVPESPKKRGKPKGRGY